MEYQDFQQHLIVSVLDREAISLKEIVRKCGGLYPTELRSFLEKLVTTGKIGTTSSGYKLADSARSIDLSHLDVDSADHNSNTVPTVILPQPHPHDYDWRFDKLTSSKLSELVVKETPKGGAALLLGAPSVFAILVRHPPIVPNLILLDWSNELVNYLKAYNLPSRFSVIQHNLLEGSAWETNQSVNTVVCDPPWYPEYYKAFLAQAAYSATLGASIILSLMPINTRPQAATDRWQIFETAQRLGLHLSSIELNAIQYDTPAFEEASLHCSEINLERGWRRSDLAIFRKVAPTDKALAHTLLSEVVGSNPETREWVELLLGRNKIKLRGPFDDYEVTPDLISIEEKDTLPTVSRRYEGRKAVDLWLWDNRVFQVKGKAAFLTALSRLTGKLATVDSRILPRPQAVNQALSLLLPLVNVES